MDNFEINIGGKEIPEVPAVNLDEEIPEVKRQIESNNVFMEKWNMCRHRSDKMDYTVKTCCRGLENHYGYVCHKLDIKNLTPQICQNCNHYTARAIIEQST